MSQPPSERTGTAGRNVVIGGRRTSIRLTTSEWDALDDLCKREDLTLDELCEHVIALLPEDGLTPALRRVLIAYYRKAAEMESRPPADSPEPASSGPATTPDASGTEMLSQALKAVERAQKRPG